MEEIAPGIWHWSAYHPRIRTQVSSYYVAPAGAVIDPMLPDEGLAWFEERDERPSRVLLTNRHHYRRSDKFVEAFGSEVRASRPGMHEFEGGPEVRPFDFGDEVAPGIVAHEIGGICPDDSALHIQHGGGAIAFADGVIRYGSVGFVPDSLWDDPENEKAEVCDSVRRLLDLDFDHLLFAHGEPLAGGGKDALRELVGD
jgi:hypothetical protein